MKVLSKEKILPEDLPKFADLKHEAKNIASKITIGKTLFMEKNNVSSEAEYKLNMKRKNQLMRHAHIGWNSWTETSNAFEKIYSDLDERGFTLDRFGVILDWTMGVPKHLRSQLPKATGLILENEEQWNQLGQIVPIHPHMGDHMIGSLNSVENVRLALTAGATSIGNLSQYYTFDYSVPYDLKDRAADLVKAVVIMAQFRDSGALLHSNLCDGFGAQFRDQANLIGWAMLERYIVEELVGAKLSHIFGNLFNSNMSRIIFSLALDDVHEGDSIGTMIYGNTTDYTKDFDHNYGVLSTFTLADFIAQIYKPTGHAITPIPITEAIRIPTADEIIQAQIVSNQVEEKAQEMAPYMNWEKIISEKDKLIIGGEMFFERMLNGLSDMGINVKDPVEIFISLRNIGAPKLESLFGVGRKVKEERIPIKPTDIRKSVDFKKTNIRQKMAGKKQTLLGTKVVLGSTDVHEYGRELVLSVLEDSDATVYDLGSGVTAEEVIEMAIETESDFIAISTFIGIALSFGRKLMKMLKEYDLNIPVVMGGLLNENQDNENLAIDVTPQLEELGVITCSSADEIISIISKYKNVN